MSAPLTLQPPLAQTPLPRSAVLAWLADAGPDVPMPIRSRLLDEMVGSPRAALAGPLNGMLLGTVALSIQGGLVFGLLLAIEAMFLVGRVAVLHRHARNRARGIATAPDLYLALAALWCGLQGAVAFACIRSGVPTLQILAAASVLALAGPICARNYGAPRFATLLIGLSLMPLVAAAQTLGQPWLLVMLVQALLLLVGAGSIVRRYHDLSISALRGQAVSHERAVHDPLTGLLNRSGLHEALQRRWPPGLPVVLLYLDLDGFKPVNDTFGHQAGDLVLARVGQRLLAAVRNTDIVARMGGDEFLIAMVGMGPADGQRFAEQIVNWVSDTPYNLEPGCTVRIGVSVGYACAPADGVDANALIRNADAALYVAKAAGKNVARRFGRDEPGSTAVLGRAETGLPLDQGCSLERSAVPGGG